LRVNPTENHFESSSRNRHAKNCPDPLTFACLAWRPSSGFLQPPRKNVEAAQFEMGGSKRLWFPAD